MFLVTVSDSEIRRSRPIIINVLRFSLLLASHKAIYDKFGEEGLKGGIPESDSGKLDSNGFLPDDKFQL